MVNPIELTISRFELRWARRNGGPVELPQEFVDLESYGPFYQTSRSFLDFVIDGQSLTELVHSDYVSALGWGDIEEQKKAILRLLLSAPSDLPNNRRSILVCPECGDIGCGALTAVIEEADGAIIWRDFGYENNYDDDSLDLERYKHLDSFAFDKHNYVRELQRVS